MKKIIAVLMCLTLCLSVTSCKKKTEDTSVEKVTETKTEDNTYLGTLKPISETKILAKGKGQVIECPYEVGDMVNSGDLLYKIDDNGLGDTIQTTKNSLAKTQISINTANENVRNLKVYAPASGILKNFSIKTGERVNASKIGEISDESKIIAKVPFNESQKSQIRVGDSAVLTSADYMAQVYGKVSKIYDARAESVGGSALYNVEITVSNNGGLSSGSTVNAQISNSNGTFTSPVSGSLIEADSISVVSKGSGNAIAVHASEGQRVTKGQLLVEMENSSVTSALSRAKLDYNDQSIKLNSLQRDYDDLFVYSPISGTVTAKYKNLNDNITSNSESIMNVADISTLILEINVSEDVVKKLTEGKIIDISLSGVDIESVSGTVTAVNKDGKINGAVKNYPVTISIDNSGYTIPSNTVASVKF